MACNILQINTDGSFKASFCNDLTKTKYHVNSVLRIQGHDMCNWDDDIITAKPMGVERAWMVRHNCWDRTPNAKEHSIFQGAKGPMFAFIEDTKNRSIVEFSNVQDMLSQFYSDEVDKGIQRQINDPTQMMVIVEKVNGQTVISISDIIEMLS